MKPLTTMMSKLLEAIKGFPDNIIEIRAVIMQKPKCPGYISAEYFYQGKRYGSIVTDEDHIRYLQRLFDENNIRVSSVSLNGCEKISNKTRF